MNHSFSADCFTYILDWPVIQYFETTWMGTPNRPVLFKPSCWNQYDVCLTGQPRSSNLAEGWHNGFQDLIGCTNPTIWSFLTALKLEQWLTEQKMTDRLMRRPPPQSSIEWIRLDEKLEDFVIAKDNGGCEILNYLSAVYAAI